MSRSRRSEGNRSGETNPTAKEVSGGKDRGRKEKPHTNSLRESPKEGGKGGRVRLFFLGH